MNAARNEADPDSAPGSPIRVFVSYCRSDRRWRKKLCTHLKSIANELDIISWDDTDIRPGDQWEARIAEEIHRASIAILLVSADYLASDFIRRRELPLICRAARDRGLKVLPILVSPTRFEDTEIAQFQAVNDSTTTLCRVSVWQREDIFVRVTEAVTSIMSGKHDRERLDGEPLVNGSSLTFEVSSIQHCQATPGASSVSFTPRPALFRELRSPQDPSLSADLAEAIKGCSPELRTAVLNWASANPEDACRFSFDSYVPTARQLPAAGGLFMAIEKCWGWLVSHFAELDDNTKQILAATALLLSSLMPPVFVAHARRQRDLGLRPVPNWIPVYCLSLGIVAIAIGTVFVVQYQRAAPAAREAGMVLATLRSEHPVAARELDVIWAELPDKDRQSSEPAADAVLSKLVQVRRKEIGDRVYGFAAAKLVQDRHRTLTLVLSTSTVLIGIENLVCGAILGCMVTVARKRHQPALLA